MVAIPWASRSKGSPVTGSRSFESHLEGHAPRDNSIIRIAAAGIGQRTSCKYELDSRL